MSVKITQENYATYKMIFEIFMHHLYRNYTAHFSPETSPLAALNRWEAQSKSMARRGLQAGLNDCLSNLRDYPEADLIALNAELEKLNLPSLQTLSGAIEKTKKQVLKSEKIKTIDQYYIIKEILDDTTSEISADERLILNSSLSTYESSRKP
ncbi:hypothetical protein HRH25_12070 [Flavisolibacter sp. BT320]|nr:hypothetical protein [Flavisolibacter longurius]